MKKKAPKCIPRPKKPRTLNALWADARCEVYNGSRYITLNDQDLTATQAVRLSQWLVSAAAWKATEGK